MQEFHLSIVLTLIYVSSPSKQFVEQNFPHLGTGIFFPLIKSAVKIRYFAFIKMTLIYSHVVLSAVSRIAFWFLGQS